MIGVLLVEDHVAFRQALALALNLEPDLRVVGEAGTVREARDCIRQAPIDVAVVDFELPDGDGAQVIADLQRTRPGADAMVLTASASRRDLGRVVAAGAAGVLHKTAPLEEVVGAVRRLCAGEPLVPPHELVALLRETARMEERDRTEREALTRLTRREREVLVELAAGRSDKEIADRLSVSRETVRTHMVNLLGKLGVESRLQAVVLAAKHGTVTLG